MAEAGGGRGEPKLGVSEPEWAMHCMLHIPGTSQVGQKAQRWQWFPRTCRSSHCLEAQPISPCNPDGEEDLSHCI